METHSGTGPSSGPEAARAALADASSARGRIANRITTPWWYRVGWGVTLGLVLVGFGSTDRTQDGTTVIVATALGGIAALTALAWALARATGVSWERYTAGAPVMIYLAGVLVLMSAGLAIRVLGGLWWVTVPFAVGLVLWALVMEPRIDVAARRALRRGQ